VRQAIKAFLLLLALEPTVVNHTHRHIFCFVLLQDSLALPQDTNCEPELQEEVASEITRQQAELLIMAYVLRHSVSGEGLVDLLELFNVLSPQLQLSRSKFLFMKQFTNEQSFDTHYTCNMCGGYLGLETLVECPVCNLNFETEKALKKLRNSFITVSLELQLKQILSNCSVEDFGSCKHDSDLIEDSCCGKRSKFLKREQGSVTLTWNTDGVPVSGSSKRAIWPIFCSVNELSFKERSKNMILCGLWSGDKKPDMNVFLKPFVDELTRLGSEGLVATFKNGTTEKIFVFSGAISVDTPARAMCQNLKQFNGRCGCAFCEMEGERVERGRGSTRVYEEKEIEIVQRTHERFVEQACHATDKIPVMGVKGPSFLMLVPKLDIVDDFVVDYMHAGLLGVTRQMTKLWFEENDDRFSLKKKRAAIDSKILSIRPPKEIRRLPRSLIDSKFWKASEWRSFLLFYSPVVLQGEFPDTKYYKHWMLLVNGVLMLLQKKISKENVALAHLCLMKFVIQIPKLYGLQHVSYNMHLLTHLANTVLNWGPLWASSAFAFEDANGRIKELFHGTQSVPQQMVKNFLLLRSVSNSVLVKDAVQGGGDLFAKLTRSTFTSRGLKIDLHLVILGKPSACTIQNNYVLCEYTEKITDHRAEMYQRFVYRDILFASESYCQEYGREDSYVMLFAEGNIVYARVTAIAVIANCEAYLFYKKIVVDDHHPLMDQFVGIDLMSRHKLILQELTISSVCRISSLRRKCIRVGDSICGLPKFELD
jgi:hypothetical protein